MNRHLCIGASITISLAACGGSDANERDTGPSDVRADSAEPDTSEDTVRPEDTDGPEDTDSPDVCAGPSTCDDGDPCTEDSVVSGAFATCDLVCAHRSVAEDADLPDDDFVDTNCDGVDGDVDALVFVAPDGANAEVCGTTAAPCATIGYALEVAETSGKSVAVSAGTYDERVTLISGVNVYGAYDRAAAWDRSAEAQAIIASSAVFEEGGVTFLEGVLARGLASETILDRLTVRTPDAPAERVGVSNHGVRVVASPGLVLRHMTVEAGAASAGADGTRGAPGANGLAGRSGGGNGNWWGAFPTEVPPCEGAGEPQRGAEGGDGGRDLGVARPGTDDFGNRKDPRSGWGLDACGIGGGAAGRNWDNIPLVDVPGVRGGQGPSCTLSVAPGAGGLAAIDLVALGLSGVLDHGSGQGGATGSHGFGGAGGGGGGSGDADTLVAGADGGGGGGGSSGGCGGRGGSAASPGGTSVALLVVDSAGLLVVRSTFGAGAGGTGGVGGESGGGGFGGSPGQGAPGRVTDTAQGFALSPNNSLPGGNGGRGSDGAMGGGGAGGNGGNSVGAMLCRSPLGAGSADNTIRAGTAGAGGAGGYPFGQAGFGGRAFDLFEGCFIPAVDVRFGYSLGPNTATAKTELLDFPAGTAAPGWDGAALSCGDGYEWIGAVGNVAVVGGSWLCVPLERKNGRYFLQNSERGKALVITDGVAADAELAPDGECPFGGLVAFVALGSEDTEHTTWACHEPLPAGGRWEFRESAEGWNPAQASASVVAPGLALSAANGDPWITSPPVRIDTALKTLRVRMKVGAGSGATMYFMRAGEAASEERAVVVPIAPGDDYAEVVFDMGAHPLWTGVVTQLRFDFSNTQSTASIDFIALEP